MKRTIAMVGAVVVVLATAGGALAANGGSATGGVKYVSIPGNFAQSDFTAKIGPNGPQGQVHRRVVDANNNLIREFHGTVDCYSQTDNIARFSGVITQSQGDDTIEGPYFLWVVQDNGEGAKSPPDMIRVIRSTTPFDCTTSTEAPTQPITNGNIQVH